MKVAIVHEMLVKMGGAERVITSLLKKYPNADIFTLLYDEKECGKTFPKEKVTTSRLQKWFKWGVPKQAMLPFMARAIEDFDFTGYDLVISSNSAFAHGVICPSDVPHICYVHAPMRYVWDYTHTYIEEKTKSWKRVLKYPLQYLFTKLRLWDFSAAARPDVLMANSKTTQHRIQKYWRRDSEVVYPPVNIERFTPTKTHNGSYLIVSMLEPFKKIDLAVEAFLNMSEKELVIVGEGSQKQALQALAQNAKNIHFLGKKSDEEVEKLMHQARAFVFPGLEDFGITPVEAMAAGKPIIFFAKGGVTETVIDGTTGVGFTSQTPSALQQAVEHFEAMEFDTDVIRARAEEFSEEKFLERVEEIVQKVKPVLH